MNILYIGPYRLNSTIGYESLNFLLNIRDSYQTTIARSLCDGQKNISLKDISLLVDKLESKVLENIDLLIQHTDIDSMLYNTKIKKNIFIPIFGNRLLSTSQSIKCKLLNNIGPILYKNDIDNYILEKVNIKNKERVSLNPNNRLLLQTSGKINLGIYSTYKKYYTIIEKHNDMSVKKLMVNFIAQFHNEPVCLVIFANNFIQKNLEEYTAFIKNIHQSLNINYSINKIVIVPIEIDNYLLKTIHDTCDIYIGLENNIHAYYAKKFNKPIIVNKSRIIDHYDLHQLAEQKYVSYESDINLSMANLDELDKEESKTIINIIKEYV